MPKPESGIEMWLPNWYERYSLVLLREAASFKEVFKRIILSKKKVYNKSPIVEQFYTQALIVIRFLEGINWGYSPMLIHDRLEKDTK